MFVCMIAIVKETENQSVARKNSMLIRLRIAQFYYQFI